jgi:glycine cleavage system H protein
MSSADVKFTKDHEWIKLTGDEAEVGITDYAQRQLGDVVYVELPEVGRTVSKGEVFGTIESVKAVSELFTPMSGEVAAVNTELTSKPEQVNSAPDTTWIIKLKLSAAGEASELLTADQYDALTK